MNFFTCFSHITDVKYREKNPRQSQDLTLIKNLLFFCELRRNSLFGNSIILHFFEKWEAFIINF